jgi:hypothetical protein
MQTGFPTLNKWLLKGANDYDDDKSLFGCAGCVVWLAQAAFGLIFCSGLFEVLLQEYHP